MSRMAIVLDANILIRAVLGQRVRELVHAHAATDMSPHDAASSTRHEQHRI